MRQNSPGNTTTRPDPACALGANTTGLFFGLAFVVILNWVASWPAHGSDPASELTNQPQVALTAIEVYPDNGG